MERLWPARGVDQWWGEDPPVGERRLGADEACAIKRQPPR